MVLWVILLANFIVAALKLGIGISCKSQSVIADGIHSFSDGASNIVGLVGIWLASKPRDQKHPYGHEKYEILAGLFIGLMLAVMSARIVSSAITSLQNTQPLEISLLETLLMIFTIAVNTAVAFAEFRCGKRLKSTILITDSLHTRGDILISCAVLAGLVGIKMGLPVWIDPVMSIAVGIVVLLSAGKIIKNCVDVLVDSVVVDGNEVRRLLIGIPGVYDVHQIKSRGGQSHIFIDLHILVSPEVNAVYVHELSHKLEEVLRAHFGANTDVNIHPEPNDTLHDTRV